MPRNPTRRIASKRSFTWTQPTTLSIEPRTTGMREYFVEVLLAKDTPIAFKELTGITRKYAIPLLEYLDREHVTRRVGDERVIL